jgi:2-amino-4-hydroxy-6-hydroxymethyldihydropteridine diphosphokinase
VPVGPDPGLGASALLVAFKQLERAFGRKKRRRWGPRELDLDLLVFGQAQLSIDPPAEGASSNPATSGLALRVPHPEARNRLFVLTPLAELAPRLVPPGWGETVESARLRQEALEGTDAVVPVAVWDSTARRWTA